MTDGTSNTILSVHAPEQVPWAAPRELRFRACQALPPALPRIRTVEAVADRLDAVEHKLYPDCAERLRQAVEAYDELKNALTPQ